MVLKRVLPARQSRLLVTAPSSRNVNMVDDEDDESEQGMTTTSSSTIGTRKKSESAQRGLGLTDTIGIELGIVFGAAIFFRRLWILHFIHFIVLRRTLILAIAWIDYFFDAGIYEEVKRTALYIYRISMSHTEKALSGDSMRLFFAASWLQNYSTWGYQIWFAILRRQYKHVNKLELSEQEAKLQTTEMLVEKRRQQRGD